MPRISHKAYSKRQAMSSSSTANGSGSLRPTWSRSSGTGGRGFQPPPPVPTERRTRSGSQGSSGSNDPPKSTATNKFAALDDDEDDLPLGRSPPFRSVPSFGQPKSPSNLKGRSLADLASTVPDTASIGRAHSTGYRSAATRSDSISESSNVIRFTREKLLALRPRPDPNLIGPPLNLKHLEDNPILSQQPLDPGKSLDCYDHEFILRSLLTLLAFSLSSLLGYV